MYFPAKINAFSPAGAAIEAFEVRSIVPADQLPDVPLFCRLTADCRIFTGGQTAECPDSEDNFKGLFDESAVRNTQNSFAGIFSQQHFHKLFCAFKKTPGTFALRRLKVKGTAFKQAELPGIIAQDFLQEHSLPSAEIPFAQLN